MLEATPLRPVAEQLSRAAAPLMLPAPTGPAALAAPGGDAGAKQLALPAPGAGDTSGADKPPNPPPPPPPPPPNCLTVGAEVVVRRPGSGGGGGGGGGVGGWHPAVVQVLFWAGAYTRSLFSST